MNEYCIVVSGLPASGKSTIGTKIANAMELPLFDKDQFLEKLFESKGIGDAVWRAQLSHMSNRSFQTEALKARASVLVSHWRGTDKSTGTPVAWIPICRVNMISRARQQMKISLICAKFSRLD